MDTLTPATFDVSVWEFFLPLLCGATLVVAGPDAHRDPTELARLIRSQGITTAHFVPSMLDAFLAAAQDELGGHGVDHHELIAHVEGDLGFRAVRIDGEEARELLIGGEAQDRELAVVGDFGGLQP